MKKIFPFSGVRYNPEHIDNLANVISQPYDKITADERAILWRRHDKNVVRLILPPPDGADTDFVVVGATESSDWYEKAAERLQAWIRDGVLISDAPRLYVYRQHFSYRDRSFTRTGLFVSLGLDDEDGPLAHEHTFEGPKADRFRLISATQANLSPIFLLSDGDMEKWSAIFSKTNDSLAQFEDLDGQKHEILSITDAETIQTVQDFVQDRTLVIADGHHRYETAQNYKKIMMQETGLDPDREPWGCVMAFIVPAESPDLLVLPTHRVISQMPDGWMNDLLSNAEPYCSIEPLTDYTGDSLQHLLAKPEHGQSIAVIAKDQGFLLTLKEEAAPHSLTALAPPLRRLNVSILHQFLFESCLNLSPTALQGITRYIRSEDESLARVQSGEAQAAFLLGGLLPQTVLDVSQHRVRMPQKSTDFYPKIPTGLIFRSVAATK
ncbi:MAG: DUF1015 domain-containing protein [Candidatus Omnitrophica bacterium]|nr:DUF1015 domain-containing protein [Candidatus Omnitrophota bacterium]